MPADCPHKKNVKRAKNYFNDHCKEVEADQTTLKKLEEMGWLPRERIKRERNLTDVPLSASLSDVPLSPSPSDVSLSQSDTQILLLDASPSLEVDSPEISCSSSGSGSVPPPAALRCRQSKWDKHLNVLLTAHHLFGTIDPKRVSPNFTEDVIRARRYFCDKYKKELQKEENQETLQQLHDIGLAPRRPLTSSEDGRGREEGEEEGGKGKRKDDEMTPDEDYQVNGDDDRTGINEDVESSLSNPPLRRTSSASSSSSFSSSSSSTYHSLSSSSSPSFPIPPYVERAKRQRDVDMESVTSKKRPRREKDIPVIIHFGDRSSSPWSDCLRTDSVTFSARDILGNSVDEGSLFAKLPFAVHGEASPHDALQKYIKMSNAQMNRLELRILLEDKVRSAGPLEQEYSSWARDSRTLVTDGASLWCWYGIKIKKGKEEREW